ncbi:far upstream element-binding protein 1 [Eucalyptus grandis]|uniref:far upstream element-binding protein 1 n=1 Tax=Eucalyptus grandis TaxID=71139 RepID=UPI00192EFA72|nr:far upstream element-binding protein 1 [Eucalyptus grandis]
MADEDVVAISPPSDHKRKLDDVDADQTLAPAEAPDADAAAADADADGYAADGYAAAAGSDSPDVKRPRLDGDPEVSETANGNGYPHEKGDEPVEENGIVTTLDGSEVEEAQLQSNVSEGIVDNEKTSVENHGAGDLDDARGTSEEEVVPIVDVNEQDVPSQEQQASDDGHTLTHKIEVPNSKVGVLIGKNGDTIRYLQYNSGVKIQIVRDAEADMSSTTRPVELTGTKENISKAEKLIKDVIAEADAGGSPSLVAKGIASAHIPGSAEQIELKVPNEKVGILIGRGGDTIKSLQTRSGARIQLIPQHLPEGDDSKERVVRLTGDRRQIDVATQMIKEVIKQTPRHSSLSGGFSQQAHRSRGSGGPQWGPRAPYSSQQVQYDYQQRGPYQYQNPQYSSTPYGGYPSPRSGFGPGWEQRAPPRGGSYDFFGGHGGHPASMPPHSGSISGHFSGQSGPPQSLAGYNYGQPRGANYGHPGPYSQAGNPQQNYGHGYEETKYENAAVHPSYGGQNSGPVYSQTAAAAASQTGYAQQYGSSQPIQQYGSSVPSQQAFQYPAGGSVQQTYPTYASAPTTDGSQPGAVYPQQVQAAPAYGQTATTGAYGSYPEQPATANLGYGYQASQDAGYGGGAGATYAAAPGSQTQPGYGQQPNAQLGYDQSVAQSGGYGSVPVSAQASYPQYDSSQVYGAR